MRNSLFILVLALACGPFVEAASLWSRTSPANSYFRGGNASRVGDILTIEIDESSLATEVADSESERETTILGRITGLFNLDFDKSIFGQQGNGGAIDYPSISLNGQNDFEGETEVERRGTFQAQVSATVVRIDDNGNFIIEARKTIKVGKENKSIILSGKIRKRDISAANSVPSGRIADAQISYEGGGPITSGADPGVFNRLLRFFF